MKFSSALIAVHDIEVSKKFYKEILGQEISLDYGINVTFQGGFALQEDFDGLVGFPADKMKWQPYTCELYFEEKDFDAFAARLRKIPDIQYVHDVKQYPWKQRVIRIFDPDGHMIEIGESMIDVALRHLEEGQTPEMVAESLQFPLEFIKALQNGEIPE